ncbi:MAG: DUF2974 domain-containing protein [Desulfitobacteriaceae bacterium]|nr:DUF2974 domain-containing protein [Desulfitobacteriaceae bacterium]
MEFDGIVPSEAKSGSIPLSKVAEQLRNKPSSHNSDPFFGKIPEFLQRTAQSERFRDVEISCYVNQVNHEQSMQFSAAVFSINAKQHFIAFRGTDYSLAGWKEDFQMSFTDEVQAQRNAKTYTHNIFSKYKGNFYLGGHSKGGNLAVYSAAHATAGHRKRTIGVFNYDGPGFQTKMLQSEGYQRIVDRIKTFLPKSSIVGMLLEHGEEYRVISSDAPGIMQHNPFSWKVSGTHFVYEKGLTKSSQNFSKTVRLWLDQLSIEQRAQFVEAMFSIIQATGALSVSELSKEKLTTAYTMIKTLKNMNPQTKSFLKKTIQLFFSETQIVMRNSIKEDINSLFPKKDNKL